MLNCWRNMELHLMKNICFKNIQPLRGCLLNRYLIYLYLIPSGFYVENFTLAEIVNAQKNEVKNLNQ